MAIAYAISHARSAFFGFRMSLMRLGMSPWPPNCTIQHNINGDSDITDAAPEPEHEREDGCREEQDIHRRGGGQRSWRTLPSPEKGRGQSRLVRAMNPEHERCEKSAGSQRSAELTGMCTATSVAQRRDDTTVQRRSDAVTQLTSRYPRI
jgi:hypothetical protein